MTKPENFKTVVFPVSRIATVDIGGVGFGKHHMKALVELDVTEACEKLVWLKQQGEKISFNSWLIKCISETIHKHKMMHGIRSGKRKVVIFDDIDISIMVESTIEGVKAPLPYVIRKTNFKNIREINREIETAKEQAINGKANYVLGNDKNRLLMKFYYSLPGPARRLCWKLILRNPYLVKKNMGTVMVTSVGMIGDVKGWFIPVSVHPLCFAIGSIEKKPGVVAGRIEIREHLYLTALVDHDVVDGAPAIRALTDLKKLVETGYGLS